MALSPKELAAHAAADKTARLNNYLWADIGVGVPCWHIRPQRLLEWSRQPLIVLAKYICKNMLPGSIDVWLERMRPVTGQLPLAIMRTQASHITQDGILAYTQNLDAIELLHAKECPGCPWNGKTLFP